MAGPTVGEVKLKAAIEGDDLRSQLTKEIQKEVMPQLQGLMAEINDLNEEIGKVSARPFEDIAKHAGIASTEVEEVNKATRSASRAEAAYRTQVLATQDAIKKRAALASKARAEEREHGKVSMETSAALERQAEKAAIAITKRDTAQAEWAARLEAVEKKRAEASVKYSKMIQDARDDEIQGYRDLVDNALSASQDIINDAMKRSKAQIEEEKRHTKAVQDEESKRTRAIEGETKKQERARRKAEREAARVTGSLSSVLGAVTNLGPRAASPGGIGAIVGIASAVSQLTSVASAASQSLLALPGALAAGGAAALSFKAALLGVDDALKLVFDPDADPKKLAEALNQLSPAAQRFLGEIRKMAPALKELQERIQDAFFNGLGPEINKAFGEYRGMLEKLGTGIMGAFNNMAKAALDELMTPEMQAMFQDFTDNVVRAFDNLVPAIAPLTKALGQLIDVGSAQLPEFAAGLTRGAEAFAKLIDEMSKSGDLDRMMRLGIDAVEQLTGVVGNLIEKWFELAPIGEKILPDVVDTLNNLIDSLPGLMGTLSTLSEEFKELSAVIKLIGEALQLVNSTDFSQGLVPALETIANPLRFIEQLLRNINDLLPGDGMRDFIKTVTGIDIGSNKGKTFDFTERNKQLQAQGLSPQQAMEQIQKEFAEGRRPAAPMPDGSLFGGQSPLNLDLANRYAEADKAAHPRANGEVLGPGQYRRRDGSIGTTSTPEQNDKANKQSAADIKKEVEAMFPLSNYTVDPWKGVNAPNVQGGLLQVAIPNGIPGLQIPGTAVGGSTSGPSTWLAAPSTGGNADLAAALKGKGFTDEQIRLIQAFSKVEGNNPSGVPTLGFTDSQAGTTLQGHVDALAKQFQDRASVAGPFPSGGTDQQMAEWIAKLVGQAGLSGDWQGNAQPQDYVARVVSALRGGGLSNATGGLNPMPVSGGAPVTVKGSKSGLQPAAGSLFDVIEQYFPQIKEIGGVRNDPLPYHPSGRALDIMIPGQGGLNDPTTPEGKALGDQIYKFLMDNAEALGIDKSGTLWQQKDHYNHIHAQVLDQLKGAPGGALTAPGSVPLNFGDNMYAQNSGLIQDPTTGQMGYFQVDSQALQEAARSLTAAGQRLAEANRNLDVVTELQKRGQATESDILEARQKQIDAEGDLIKEKQDYDETARGKFKDQQLIDYNKRPKGDPLRFLAGLLGGAGADNEDINMLLGGINSPGGNAGLGSIFGNFGAAVGQPVGQVASQVATDAIKGVNLPYAQGPASNVVTLAQQGNPLTPAAMAGLNVPDYTIQGGGPEAQNLLTNQGPVQDASGRIFSDTSALLDRSFTSLRNALEAKMDQLKAVLDQVKDRLAEEVVGPVVEQAVSKAITGAASEIGTAIGQAAGPEIARAVAAAIPSSGGATGNPGSALVNTGAMAINGIGQAAIGAGRAGGGVLPGYSPGVDNMLVPMSGGEGVIIPEAMRALGSGWLYNLNRSYRPSISRRGYATGGNVKADSTVGADFFGVSQVPIIGAIINLLIGVLLKVLGVQIDVRDTLDEMGKDFRDFRGDAFQTFEASGRLMNDTSALLDRSASSEQAATDERVRILKQVIEATIKYIIEKIVVPIGKALGQAAVQAGAGAAGGAISTLPGGSLASGAVEGVISAAGNAAIEIGAQVYTDFANALTSVLTDVITNLIRTLLPDMVTKVFGGGILAMIANPIGSFLSNLLGGFGSLFTNLFGNIFGLFGGIGSLIALPTFDRGGLALGEGFLPKATVKPERVLSDRQTANHEKLTGLLDKGLLDGLKGSGKTIQIHAPITVLGGPDAGQNVQDSLLSLID